MFFDHTMLTNIYSVFKTELIRNFSFRTFTQTHLGLLDLSHNLEHEYLRIRFKIKYVKIKTRSLADRF